MGLFDFFKTPKENQMENLMSDIEKKIFPYGKDQIDKEIRELMGQLGFRYSYEQIKSTYIHACAIYYVASDKSLKTIVTSILLNKKSIVTKEDAIRIYEYLLIKFQRLVKTNLVSHASKEISSCDKLFMVAKGGIVELKRNYKDLSDEGKFECLILNTLVALNALPANDQRISELTSGINSLLISQAQTNRVRIPSNQLTNFIKSRFRFYSNELELFFNTEDNIPARLYSVFYIYPLSPNPEPNFDLGEILPFSKAFSQMVKWVNQHGALI